MTQPYTTTATSLEGQILELTWQLKQAYIALDTQNTATNEQNSGSDIPLLSTNNASRITIDPDIDTQKVSIRAVLDIDVSAVGEVLNLQSVGLA